MFWSPREDRFQAALVLQPGEPMTVAVLALYLGMLALGDALGSLLAPGIDVTFIWPNRINLNGGALGTVEIDAPLGTGPQSTPDWVLLSFDLAISGEIEDKTATTLQEEGCFDVSSVDLLESLARHALVWSNRWHDDGFAPLRPSWTKWVHKDLELVSIGTTTGRFIDLDTAGDLLIDIDGDQQTIGLIDALGCLDP